MTEKECSQCKVKKPLSEFYAHKRYEDGKRPNCKSCFRKRNTRLNSNAANTAYMREYRARKQDADNSMRE